MSELSAIKKELRREFLKKREELDKNIRAKADNKICTKLIDLCDNELKPTMVAAYISDGTEVNLEEFINAMFSRGVKVCIPRFNKESQLGEYEMVEITNLKNDLMMGHYHIMEPVESCRPLKKEMYDNLLWLVPGVVFDEQCGRVGRGKGVYDRMNETFKGINIGAFYECQKTVTVPMAEHDHYLDLIVTERGIYRSKKMINMKIMEI